MRSCLITAVCVVVLCITLTLGLWPFHATRNDVSWLGDRNGLHFGRTGTVSSAGEFRLPPSQNQASVSLEIWLQPRRIWDFSTFLTFYIPGNPLQFSLRQAQTSLLLQAAIQEDQPHSGVKDLYVENTFHRDGPAFIAVTSGAQGTAVYIDGVLAKNPSQMRLSPQVFTGRLVLGDSVGQADSWSGQLLGFSIYDRELTAAQVLEHCETWTKMGRPEIAGDEANTALYLFDERSGRTIHSKIGSASDLYIPEKYAVLGKIFLESPWSEWRRSQGYWSAILKNVVGFIPFGCCFYVYFSLARQTRRPALATVVLGFGVSLTIEVLQAFLPTRASGATDLITNTLGTWIGVMLVNAAMAPWELHRRILEADRSPN